jgi:MerR family transcriptional regulator/heat shock protein HspR
LSTGGTVPLYTISIAAKLIRIERPDEPLHPQTLRMYERLGLVTPQRVGKNRLYSDYDVQRVRQIQALTDLGVNLAGVEIILGLKERLDSLEAERETFLTRLRQYE